ncbi:peptidase U32 [Oribacterium sp. C9]|uniref:peptidase U32 family protein n=1 Tax=Oribacterium sp. C9 TaxID=1943579 RepID=UPI00098EDF21|nr:U32 family peptidase [Oribacterium sp. C9]OON85312.1 peptidase U32 [Oribacterium sp. C9]
MKLKRDRRVELLAPAGSFRSVVAAVNAGADAIYMGGRKFGARAYADSAKAEEEDMVMEAIRYCHLFSVKLYMTVNILFKDLELKELFSYIKPYYEAGVDGLIMQDLGAVKKIREWFPDLEVHASTQETISGVNGARMAQKFGMTRAVCSRELSLSEIKRIHDETGMELEVFCHGAMCYSYSGACFMSSLLGGRSGNRGRCAGTCRLCYEAISHGETAFQARAKEGAGEEFHKKAYLLSMKDMQTIDLLPELIEAGAYSFKIEGRMKSPIYTAGVVSVYRKYLDLAMKYLDGEIRSYSVDPDDVKILREVFDRGGVTSYLKKHNGADMIATEEKKFREVEKSVLDHINSTYIDRNRTLKLDADIKLTVGAPVVLTLSDAKGRMVTVVSEDSVASAESHPMDAESIETKLRKTGGTVFTFESVNVSLEGDIFYPVGKLNQLRREALDMYEEEILSESKRQLV